MAERDGTIVIDTQIDTKGVDAGSEKTEASLRRMAQKVNDIGATAKAALNKQIDAFARLNSQYDSQSEKIDALKRKIAGYSDEYGEMQAKIDETVKKLNDLEMMQGVIKDAVKDSAKRGTTFDTTQYKWVQEDIEKLTKEIEVAEREQDKLFATGNPFELGSKARAAKEDLEKLSQEEGKLAEDTTSKASSGNSGSSGGGVDPGQMFEDVPIESNIEKIFQKIKDLIKSGDFEGLGEMMADAINRGLKKVKKAISWDNVGPTVTYFVTAFTRTFNSLVDNIDWDLLGRTIGTGINTIVNTLDLFYTGIDWKNLGSKFAEGVNGVVYEVDWAKLGQFIGHKLLALPTVIVGFIENLDWSALSKAASTLVLNFLDTLIEFILECADGSISCTGSCYPTKQRVYGSPRRSEEW